MRKEVSLLETYVWELKDRKDRKTFKCNVTNLFSGHLRLMDAFGAGLSGGAPMVVRWYTSTVTRSCVGHCYCDMSSR